MKTQVPAKKPESRVGMRLYSPAFDQVASNEISRNAHDGFLRESSLHISNYNLSNIPIQSKSCISQQGRSELPNNIKTSIESLTNISMEDVSVYYNSTKPSQLQSLAYTQGTNIYVAPGQEKHLLHEAWHVVQQKQGRVIPSEQMQGVLVSKDISLEKEADVMASRILNLPIEQTPAIQERLDFATPKIGQPPLKNQVVQMKYDIKTTAEQQKELIDKQQSNNIHSLDWTTKLAEAYLYIIELKKVIEDDSEVEEIEESELNIDACAKKLDDLTQKFGTAPPFAHRRPRKKNSTYSIPAGNLDERKRKRSDSDTPAPEKVHLVSPQEDIAREIAQLYLELFKLHGSLKKTFPLREGGFSAKARAHEMDGSETFNKDTHSSEVPTWFKNISFNGKKPLDTKKRVYKKDLKITEDAGKLAIGREISDLMKDEDKLDKFEELVEPLTTEHKIPALKRAPQSRDRDGGQMKNMADTNAQGYASFAGVSNWQSKRWEWLHIRAASLGGATNGSNLVLGTKDANTHMMPFEANIRTIANIVKEDLEQKQNNYDSLNVEFSVLGVDSKAKHKVNAIKISWRLKNHSSVPSGAKEFKGEAVFDPLNTKESISKTEVKIIEDVLKKKREKISGSRMDVEK